MEKLNNFLEDLRLQAEQFYSLFLEQKNRSEALFYAKNKLNKIDPDLERAVINASFVEKLCKIHAENYARLARQLENILSI